MKNRCCVLQSHLLLQNRRGRKGAEWSGFGRSGGGAGPCSAQATGRAGCRVPSCPPPGSGLSLSLNLPILHSLWLLISDYNLESVD